jgi:hypothetical protein
MAISPGGSQPIPVYVKLDGNPGQALLPGMSAEVTIHP